MPFPSVTYTFTNGSTADATQVNQNFTDLINGLSDTTKNISVSAGTFAGTLTASGNVSLGASTSFTITMNGSVNTNIVFSSTNAYDIGGSTIGVRSIYLADAGSAARATRIIGATIGSAWTLTLPTGAGTSRYRLETDGSGVTSWNPVRRSGFDLHNGTITATSSGGTMTVSLVTIINGTAASSTDPIDLVFRNVTAATGTSVVRTVTASNTLSLTGGLTLGAASGVAVYIYVYALDNAGTIELAASLSRFDDGSVQSTNTGGTSNQQIYSLAARTNVPVRLIARVKATNTASSWGSPTEVSTVPFIDAAVICTYTAGTGTSCTSGVTTQVAFDTKEDDTHNAFASNQFTAPIAGYYLVHAMVSFPAENDNAAIFNLWIYKNGSSFSGLDRGYGQANTATSSYCMSGSRIIKLSAGDTVRIYVDQTSGTSRTTIASSNTSWVSICRLPGI